MAIKYSIIQRPKPGDPTAPKKFYALIKTDGEVSLRELANQIASISTVSTIDTMAVLESLVQVIPNHLLNGRIVRLGDLGSFYVTLSSGGADTEDDFTTSLIKKANVSFRPGKLIKNKIKTATFEKA